MQETESSFRSTFWTPDGDIFFTIAAKGDTHFPSHDHSYARTEHFWRIRVGLCWNVFIFFASFQILPYFFLNADFLREKGGVWILG